MRLEKLRVEERADSRRVAADVIWENTDRVPQTLYFEAPYPVAADLQPSPDAFALACLPFASWWGERRLQVEGSLCTRFEDGLRAVIAIQSQWFEHCVPLTVDPLDGYVPTRPRTPAWTASLLSGGVDGLAALRANRLSYPVDHPEAIRECILLFGVNDFDSTADGPVPERLEAFRRLESRLRALADAEQFELVPIKTNTRLLSGDYLCWTSVGVGAGISAVAHTLSPRVSKVLLASAGDGANPGPAASHPLLAQHFSTAAVQVQHEQASWSRIDKLRLLAGWPAALELMQPCHYVRIPPPGLINCGRCEKCVRTMLGLLALGKLADARAFADNDVTPEMVRSVRLLNRQKAGLLGQLMEPLQAAGRPDLVREIKRKVRAFHLRQSYRRLKPRFLRRRSPR
jgi:hypothetical protein